jgi:hypothetical protein
MMLQPAPTVFAVPFPIAETGAVFYADATAASPQVLAAHNKAQKLSRLLG